MTRLATRRGFSLIELLIASAIAVALIAAAISVGVQLQRRGFLEERTMETQNAARAARDLIDSSLQRAGAGAGTAPLVVGTAGGQPDYRYAIRVDTGSTALTTSQKPSGLYSGLTSDILEIWETDPGQMVPLVPCQAPAVSPWYNGNLCTSKLVPNALKGKPVAIVALQTPTGGTRPFACFGVLGTNAQTVNLNLHTIDWTAGRPGSAPPTTHECGKVPAAGDVLRLWNSADLYLMPVTARTFRVTWSGDKPTLEMDPDGFAGTQDFVPVTNEVERLRVRLGVVPTLAVGTSVQYFPESAGGDAGTRPALDTCTNSACDDYLTWDAGALAAEDRGPGSAQDRLMERVRMVEVLITARSQRLDRLSDLPTDGGIDEDGNIQDGYKRRHTVARLSPRNFLFEGF